MSNSLQICRVRFNNQFQFSEIDISKFSQIVSTENWWDDNITKRYESTKKIKTITFKLEDTKHG